MESIKGTVAKNLQELRKAKGLTQAELAEKLSYSDKSVSKWENGESLPDIDVLVKLTELYDVTLDFLVHEDSMKDYSPATKEEADFKVHASKIVISSLFVTSVWLIATMIFVYLLISREIYAWVAFLWAVPSSLAVLFVCNRRWGKALYGYIFASLFVWSLIISLCVQFIQYNIWPIVIIGVPIQVALILISRLRK